MSFWKSIRRIFIAPEAAGNAGPDRDAPPGDETFPEAVRMTDELDLHGFFPEQIGEVMEEFLTQALELGIEEVRIAHGKGRSVLKREVWKVLEADGRVVAFGEAPPHRGGWGATVARLVRKGEVGESDPPSPGDA